MLDKKQPIIIKKITKGGAGHHGGAWKVAFADFVTAMMAFFLLMWLMSSTTKEQKAAISEYFDNPSMTESTSTAPAPSAIQGPGGASKSLIDMEGALDTPRVETRDKKEEPTEQDEAQKQRVAEEERQEKKRLDELMEKLKATIEQSQALKPFKDQLLLDITPEGLRIQIVDKENRPMFDSGKSTLKFYTVEILEELARVISDVPNRISLSGHTDATPFASRGDYSNWELSADRANAARRVLVGSGVEKRKVGRVLGLASSTLFDKANPKSPINRRISIIVMNKRTEEALAKSEGVSEEIVRDHREVSSQSFPELPMEFLEP